MLKKMKLPGAILLLVQTIVFFVLFLVLWGEKKSLSLALLFVAAESGVGLGFLIAAMRKEISATTVEFDDELDMDESEVKADLSGTDDEEAIAF
jgi:NADH:ubiquinone oxidoreductase subunit K